MRRRRSYIRTVISAAMPALKATADASFGETLGSMVLFVSESVVLVELFSGVVALVAFVVEAVALVVFVAEAVALVAFVVEAVALVIVPNK